MYPPTLPERIRQYREESALTLADMADRLSMDLERYRQYEHGEIADMQLEELKRISAIFGIGLMKLLFPEIGATGPFEGDYPLDEATTLHYLQLLEEKNRTIDQLNTVIAQQEALLKSRSSGNNP